MGWSAALESNKKKRKTADKALDYAGLDDGVVEIAIKGSGVKKKWKEIAAKWKYDD